MRRNEPITVSGGRPLSLKRRTHNSQANSALTFFTRLARRSYGIFILRTTREYGIYTVNYAHLTQTT